MSIIILLMPLVVFLIVMTSVTSQMHRRVRGTSQRNMQRPVRMIKPAGAKQNRRPSSARSGNPNGRVLPQRDLPNAYSLKNKDCHENEVKVSMRNEKPKRKKSLWNEPSWDDELYS